MHYDIPYLALSDSSVNSRLRSCRRKFEFNKLYGHARAEREESIPADAGTALHKAWQTYMAEGSKNRGIEELMFAYPSHLQKSPMQERSLEACYTTFLEMIANPLHARYQLATVNVDGVVMPAVEVPFRIVLANTSLTPERHVPIFWDGFIDAILWDTLELRYVVVDIKTTRKQENDYTAMFGNDPQTLPYAYVVENAVGQAANSGLNVIYLVAYVDHLFPRVQQIPLYKSENDIRSWAFGLAMDIQNIRHMADIGFFPKDGKSCVGYGTCQYIDVCGYTEPTAIREWLDLRYGPPDHESVAANFHPWFTVNLEITGLA
jgi:hypothetical protein